MYNIKKIKYFKYAYLNVRHIFTNKLNIAESSIAKGM